MPPVAGAVVEPGFEGVSFFGASSWFPRHRIGHEVNVRWAARYLIERPISQITRVGTS